MRIDSATNSMMSILVQKTGNKLPTAKNQETEVRQEKAHIRELATSINPRNMSWQESMDLANALMKAGEGNLSTAFLPPPLLRLNDGGRITNEKKTFEGNARMNSNFSMIDRLNDRIEYQKQNNQPTEILDNALAFLEKLEVAQTTPSINTFT